jgi:hypothetical protein
VWFYLKFDFCLDEKFKSEADALTFIAKHASLFKPIIFSRGIAYLKNLKKPFSRANALSGGKPKSPKKIPNADHTKTDRKDANGHVIWMSKSGQDKVRRKATSGAHAGKMTWRKAVAT